MSRKARISEEDKKQWNCVRCWTATKGYTAYKPPKEYLHDALVILEHECDQKAHGSNPMINIMGMSQEILFRNNDQINISTILLIDFAALVALQDSEKEGQTTISEEASLSQFGKKIEKPVVRFIERLNLRNATIVSRGVCCQLAMKLLSPIASRSFTSRTIRSLLMLNPIISSDFINSQLNHSKFTEHLKNIQLHVGYANSKEKRRRDPILRHYCPSGESVVWEDIAHENIEVLIPSLLLSSGNRKLKNEANALPSEAYIYDEERYDTLGRSIFFAEIQIVHDPITKLPKQLIADITEELKNPIKTEEKEDKSSMKIDINDCINEIGGLVLRGNRCVLCRSVKGEWKGMRIPSQKCKEGEMSLDCAIRSVSHFCGIDGETEVKPILNIPPVNIYMPAGRPLVLTIYALYASQPPPDGPLEDQDIEDIDDVYDWYTFPRAIAALSDDDATKMALQTMAYALKAAAYADILPMKWGGYFGQEEAGVLLGTRTTVVEKDQEIISSSLTPENKTSKDVLELVRKIRNNPQEGQKKLAVTVLSGRF